MLTSFNKKIQIQGNTIGDGFVPYIIAEMACAHDGQFEKAKKLIDASAAAGANATQLQFFAADHVVTPNHHVHGLLKDIEFDAAQWTDLVAYSRDKGIDVFVCTYDIPSVELAAKLNIDGIKLNSSDLNNPDVLTAVGESGIPFTVGTGASTLEEISNALAIIEKAGGKDVVLMHGVQNFPTQTKDLNISKVKLLKDVFGIPVGYHDHTDGEDPFKMMVDLVAIGLGANVIEKHITLDRSEKGIDYQAALEPAEYKDFVSNIHRGYVAYGSAQIKPFTESELRYRKFQKKSIVANQDLKVGDIITRDKVIFIRNAENGISPVYFDSVDGKTVKNTIAKFDNILEADLK